MMLRDKFMSEVERVLIVPKSVCTYNSMHDTNDSITIGSIPNGGEVRVLIRPALNELANRKSGSMKAVSLLNLMKRFRA